jgi:small-conductance mechanosensitive channel
VHYTYGTDFADISTTTATKAASGMIWVVISAILAVIGGIVLYFTFLSKKNEGKFTGFLGWMYDFLTFKKMMIENLLKILYLIATIFITLGSFALISTSFIAFLMTLVFGNIAARVGYELFLVTLVICRNTTDINKKLGNKEVTKKEEEQ